MRLYLYVLEAAVDGRVLRFGVGIGVDHVVADGIGVRILGGEFLRLLAEEMEYLDTQAAEDVLEWKNGMCFEYADLDPAPPWTELLDVDCMVEGNELEAAAQRQCEFWMEYCVCSFCRLEISYVNAWSCRLRISTASLLPRQLRRTTKRSISPVLAHSLLVRAKPCYVM